MLLVLVELASVDRMVSCRQHALAISHIVLPLTLVPVLLPGKDLAKAMSLISLPLTDIQIFIVVVAVSLALAEILLPFTMILKIRPLLAIRAVENAIAISDVTPID